MRVVEIVPQCHTPQCHMPHDMLQQKRAGEEVLWYENSRPIFDVAHGKATPARLPRAAARRDGPAPGTAAL